MTEGKAEGAPRVLDLLNYIEQVEKLKTKPVFSVCLLRRGDDDRAYADSIDHIGTREGADSCWGDALIV